MRRSRLALVLVPFLSACASLAALKDPSGPPATQAAWPALMPIDAALAAVPPPPAIDPTAAVAARAAALRARAAALRTAGGTG
jgi:hypothetical protein